MNKLPVKIIALDLDDTLLKDDLSIADFTVDVLQQAAQKGIYIVLSSGRTDNAILPYVRRLDVAGLEMGRYIIAQNGASITDLHLRKTIYERFVDKDVLVEAYNSAKEWGLFTEVYDDSTIFVPQANKWTDVDLKLSGLKMCVVDEYEEFLKKSHPKMVIPGEPEVLVKFQDELKQKFGKRAVVFTSKPYFLEILPANSGKGEALEWLTNHIGIQQENTMAFGDSMNDESMIRFAAESVGMLNGLEAIKKIAKHVTKYTNDEDGIAHFIKDNVL